MPLGGKIADVLIVQRFVTGRLDEVVATIGVEGPVLGGLAKDRLRVIIHFTAADVTLGRGRHFDLERQHDGREQRLFQRHHLRRRDLKIAHATEAVAALGMVPFV